MVSNLRNRIVSSLESPSAECGMQHGVNAVEMAQAYEPFDNNGVQVQAHLITKVTKTEGQVIFHPN